MFGVLRKLGLINEQISWKQRFFVPIEEERGNAVIAALLEQFPAIATEDEEAACNAPLDLVSSSASIIQPIDLNAWIIDAIDPHNTDNETQQPRPSNDKERELTDDDSEMTCTCRESPQLAQTSPVGILQQLPSDFRAPAIQIAFNFAKNAAV
jgi:hypothetical protein